MPFDHSSEAPEMFCSFLTQWQWEPPWLCPLGLGHTNKTFSVFWSVGTYEHHGLPHRLLFLWSRGRAGWAPTPQHSCTQPDASVFVPSPKKRCVQPSTYWWLLLREDRLRLLLWGLQGMWAQLMLIQCDYCCWWWWWQLPCSFYPNNNNEKKRNKKLFFS